MLVHRDRLIVLSFMNPPENLSLSRMPMHNTSYPTNYFDFDDEKYSEDLEAAADEISNQTSETTSRILSTLIQNPTTSKKYDSSTYHEDSETLSPTETSGLGNYDSPQVVSEDDTWDFQEFSR